MPNFNRVILMGNLTRDPELRYTPSGQAVTDFRLAVNRRLKTPEGERKDSVTFVDITAWGRQAEVINEYFAKGQPIFVEGRLSLDEWTSQDGQRRSKLRVVLERFEFLGQRSGAPRGGPRAPGPVPEEAPADRGGRPASPPPPPADEAEPFDDVPF
ncbi:MAG TPA: single-stranded DNA-binding protein [Planctomycetota bacterium]|nr:single-stranded DNA-binding protein [Planctomycetota bacterium]